MPDDAAESAAHPGSGASFKSRLLAFLAGGVVSTGILSGAVGLLQPFISAQIDAPVVVAEQVRRCAELHGMKNTSDVIHDKLPSNPALTRSSPHKSRFRSCDWPPRPGASKDGFMEIVVTHGLGPGAFQDPFTSYADRINASCDRFKVTYQVFRFVGGEAQLSQPFEIQKGDVVGLDLTNVRDSWPTSLPKDYPTDELPPPSPDEAILLHDDKHVINSLSCVG